MLLELLQLADSALPVGGAAHSFGLETLVEEGVLYPRNLAEFLRGYLTASGRVDAVFVRRAWRGEDGSASAAELSARRPARESREASFKIGRRFAELFHAMSGIALPSGYRIRSHSVLAVARLGFPKQPSPAYLQQSVTGLVSACQRLMPVGQVAASRLIWNLRPAIAEAVSHSERLGVTASVRCRNSGRCGTVPSRRACSSVERPPGAVRFEASAAARSARRHPGAAVESGPRLPTTKRRGAGTPPQFIGRSARRRSSVAPDRCRPGRRRAGHLHRCHPAVSASCGCLGLRADTSISVAENGLLEYLPDALIPFAGSRAYVQRTAVTLAEGVLLLVGSTLAPGRQAMGEVFDSIASACESLDRGASAPAPRELPAGARVESLQSVARLGELPAHASFCAIQVGDGGGPARARGELSEVARESRRSYDMGSERAGLRRCDGSRVERHGSRSAGHASPVLEYAPTSSPARKPCLQEK